MFNFEGRVRCSTSCSLAMRHVGIDRRWPRAACQYWASQPSSFSSFCFASSNSPMSATTGSESAPTVGVTDGASVQKANNSSNNMIAGLRNVVVPQEVAHSSSGRTSWPGELFPNPQSSRTDRTGAAAVYHVRFQQPRRVPTEPAPRSVRQV